MPAQTSKSSLFGKIGKAMKEHAHDPVDVGRIDLPPGILNGRARLTDCYFKKYETGANKGEWYLRATAVVLSPSVVATEQGDIKVEGQHTSIMLAACDTKNGKGEITSAEDNGVKIQNALKMMGADPEEVEALSDDDDLHALCASIKKAEPVIKFRTSPKYDQNDKTKVTGAWENWMGNDPDYDGKVDDEVVDNTGGKADKEDEEEEKPKTKPAAGKKSSPAKEPEPEPDDEEPDLDAMAEIADDKNNDDRKENQAALTKIAKDAGLTKKEIEEDSNSWTHLVEMIREKQGGGDEKAKAADKFYEPKKDDIVRHKGPKDKKPTEWEVTAVYEKNEKCDLKSIDDGKTVVKGVKWSDVTES